MVTEISQAVGEAVIDTILQVLDEHSCDPRIATALAEALGEPGPVATTGLQEDA
jgi:hypothetical protein